MIELAKKWFSDQPLGFVDVGARGGVHPLVDPIRHLVDALGFEADEDASLESLCVNMAISNVVGDALLYRCAASTNDSLLPINQRFVDRYNMMKFAQTGATPLRTTTLDIILADLPQQGEFLKLDTQGTEYEILCGGQRTLRERTAAIYCEVEFAQIYQGQKLFSEVEWFLRGFGFIFLGFDNMSYRSRTPWKGRERLLHADALFIKDPLEHTMSERQKQVAAMACLLCSYDDFANEILEAM